MTFPIHRTLGGRQYAHSIVDELQFGNIGARRCQGIRQTATGANITTGPARLSELTGAREVNGPFGVADHPTIGRTRSIGDLAQDILAGVISLRCEQ